MATKSYLFAVTHWLLTAGAILLLLFTVLMVVAEGALAAALLLNLGGNFLDLPAVIDGVSRNTVLAIAMLVIAALAVGALVFALICQLTAKIVESAMLGDPFVSENATRLTQIGWLLVGMEIAGVVAGLCFAQLPGGLRHEVQFDSDFSPVGILGILLIFVLAQVFRRGSEMRAELEGMV